MLVISQLTNSSIMNVRTIQVLVETSIVGIAILILCIPLLKEDSYAARSPTQMSKHENRDKLLQDVTELGQNHSTNVSDFTVEKSESNFITKEDEALLLSKHNYSWNETDVTIEESVRHISMDEVEELTSTMQDHSFNGIDIALEESSSQSHNVTIIDAIGTHFNLTSSGKANLLPYILTETVPFPASNYSSSSATVNNEPFSYDDALSFDNISAEDETYRPGELTIYENGLFLSTGLKSRLLAQTNFGVKYKNGTESSVPFHKRPDGATVVADPNSDGWVYVSNAESTLHGGVGAMTFDGEGEVIKYEMVLTGTSRNCQGGQTPWKTWVSCEEYGDTGQCWETDPFGKRPARKTVLGGDGGNYESVACDNRDPFHPQFFVTNDRSDGELRRFTADSKIVNASLHRVEGGDEWDILSSPGGNMEYLILEPHSRDSTYSTNFTDDDGSVAATTGTFRWTSDLAEGKRSAYEYFKKCEGMDIRGNTLYFVSAKQKELFALDLDGGTYVKTSTATEQFYGQPDAVRTQNDILYITEEPVNNQKAKVLGFDVRKTNDVFNTARTAGGTGGSVLGDDADHRSNFFTVLQARRWRGDASGIAFSPSRKQMYVAFMKDGVLFEITRKDGKSFGGKTLDIGFHSKADR